MAKIELAQSPACIAQFSRNECPIYGNFPGNIVMEVSRKQAGIIYAKNNALDDAPTIVMAATVAFVSGDDDAFEGYEMTSPGLAYFGPTILALLLCVALPWVIGRRLSKRVPQ